MRFYVNWYGIFKVVYWHQLPVVKETDTWYSEPIFFHSKSENGVKILQALVFTRAARWRSG